jgi:hypothetical protein
VQVLWQSGALPAQVRALQLWSLANKNGQLRMYIDTRWCGSFWAASGQLLGSFWVAFWQLVGSSWAASRRLLGNFWAASRQLLGSF